MSGEETKATGHTTRQALARAAHVFNFRADVRKLRRLEEERVALIEQLRGGTAMVERDPGALKRLTYLFRKEDAMKWYHKAMGISGDKYGIANRYIREIKQVSEEGKLGQAPNRTFDRREAAIDEILNDMVRYVDKANREFHIYSKLFAKAMRINAIKSKIQMSIVGGVWVGLSPVVATGIAVRMDPADFANTDIGMLIGFSVGGALSAIGLSAGLYSARIRKFEAADRERTQKDSAGGDGGA
ncbi:MAG: hypothetical protein KGH58_00530 [Candidatus Micrarchaeota archaeon]|nr:hypothetical protein [Candidatus Micrarchaeota archaeon]